ncbi:putative heat repeat protein [Erysiphe necator]|uniref:Putative heat repeat protein n=1 Tax=Uncinula necator TaxID=52586 RepID=A0A0B1PGY7_UNCNE|nr:putative heat repeat protein [Erysiphe necator]
MDNETHKSARDKLFRELKPYCVKLNQLAFLNTGSLKNHDALINTTAELSIILEKNCAPTENGFDHNLADYVFYPLSQILQRREKTTDRLLELTIKCVKIILQYGWRQSIALELAKQLLILLTFMARGQPAKESSLASEEILFEALGALAALFQAVENTDKGPASFKEPKVILALGFCVTTILDSIAESYTAKLQLEALSALDAVWHCIQSNEILSKFLPGVVSTLTKCLTPSTKIRRPRRVLVRALEVLRYVLTSTLNDLSTRKVKTSQKCLKILSTSDSHQEVLTDEWLKVTSEQLRLALINIIKLRSHEAVEVQRALNSLCIALLDECHDTLSNSHQILVETCMSLYGIDSDNQLYNRKTNLTDLAFIYTNLIDLIQETAHNWMISLPKIMQTSDDTAKISLIKKLSMTQELFSCLHLRSNFLDEVFLKSLRDCITVTIDPLIPSKSLQETNDNLNSQAVSNFIMPNTNSMTFRPIIMPLENQKKIRENFMRLVNNLSPRESHVQLADEMLEYTRSASGSSLLSSYWLSFQILKSMTKNEEFDDLLNTTCLMSSNCQQESLEQELYSFSLSLLCKNDANHEMMDWRLPAVALEMIAYFALRMGHTFRTELVDTLYPVVQLLGSPSSELREHAITCLNIFSHACGYNDSSALIIQNVDYMVNAISLQLNTFNIAPQGPQVLIMMIRLSGPSILPFLDDTVDSIFAALANYHGYQKLVGILFSVLAEIVSVSSKSHQNQGIKRQISHQKQLPPVITIKQIIDSYITITTPLTPLESEEILPHEPFPHASWKSIESTPEDEEMELEHDHPTDKTQMENQTHSYEKKTFQMLLSIARLCQYYLTSSSPILRARLLDLLKISINALYSDEDQFLPLINDIWPVVIKRLYDPESFICIAACDLIAELCRCAGDFLATRISVEWSDILKLAHAKKLNVISEKKRYGSNVKFTQSSQVWEALLRMLTAILKFVNIQDVMFDDLLELFGSITWEREDINNALTQLNAEAVWLAMLISGCIRAPTTPELDGYIYVNYKF